MTTKVKLSIVWLSVFFLVSISIFLLENGSKTIELLQSGMPAKATVTEVQPVPSNSRSFHVACYEYKGDRYCRKLSGASGHVVGDIIPMMINPVNPVSSITVESGHELETLLTFCIAGGLFISSAVVTGIWWNSKRNSL